jgi:succinoglycan biosynthesis transport protein ExoP
VFQPSLSSKKGASPGTAVYADETKADALTASRLIAAIRRQAVLVAWCIAAGFAVGIIYLLTAVPLYTATANVMIDPGQVRMSRDTPASAEPAALDNTVIESQVEVFRSERVGLAVIKKLNLTEDPAFSSAAGSRSKTIWSIIKAAVGAAPSKPARPDSGADAISAEQLAALEQLNKELKISRVGRTAVLEVAYTSRDPVRAAEIANEVVKAYINDQLDARVQASRGAAEWLKKQTEELRQVASKADIAVQKFKAEHNLVASKGTLISEQQLNEIATQLVSDRAATAQAKARYLRLKNIIETHQTEAAVAESLSNSVINDLRTKYLDYAKRKSELERKLGPDHVAVTNLKNLMSEVGSLLFQELGRVAESYRNDYEVAAAREKATAENLERQQAIAIEANDAQVQLHQLEQEADSYKSLYENNLKNYRELTQQESFPIADARLIARANLPIAPSHPQKALAIAISLALGAMAGLGIGVAREVMDRVFRTTEQVREELGVTALGLLPLLQDKSPPQPGREEFTSLWRYALENPFSTFAEGLRSAKVAADVALQGHSRKVIGFVSLLPKEGKSTVAMNFATLLAAQGSSTLLIDADLRNPTVTRAIGFKGVGSLPGDSSVPALSTLLWTEPGSGLRILPCLYKQGDRRAAEGLSPETLQALLDNSDYDYVVVDLPPLGPVVNARALAPVIDAFILVVEWGATSRGAVRSVLEKEQAITNKLLGVLLNKVDLKTFQRYEHFDSDGYYFEEYQKYFKSPH